MKTRTLLILALIFMIPSVSDAQLGKLLKNTGSKVMNAVGKSTAKEANKEIDSAAQAKSQKMIDEKAAQQNQGNQDNQSNVQSNQGGKGLNFGGLLGNKIDLKYNEEYKFTSRMIMQMEMYDKKDVVKMDFYVYFSKNSPNAGFETKTLSSSEGESVPLTSQMIMDGENKCFIALTDMGGMKMGMISALDDSVTTTNPSSNAKPPQMTRTGNSRVIAGYKCEEVVFKGEESSGYTKLWYTNERVLDIDKRAWTKAGMTSYSGYPGIGDGVVMASEMYDKDNKLTSKSETKEINNNFSHTMSPKGYTLRQLKNRQDQKK